MKKKLFLLFFLSTFLYAHTQNIEYICRGVQQIRRTFDVPNTSQIIVKTTKINGTFQYDTIIGNDITIIEDPHDVRYDITITYSNLCQETLKIFYITVDSPTISIQNNDLFAYFDDTHYGYSIQLTKNNHLIQNWFGTIDTISVSNLSSGDYKLYISKTNGKTCGISIPITIP